MVMSGFLVRVIKINSKILAQPNGCLYICQPFGCIMIERRDVFQAIADPTRRIIISKLSQGPLNITQIGEDLEMSKQAIAKHIKILKECGMIVMNQKGREQVCEAQLAQLDEVTDWVAQSRKLWNQRFEKLDQFLSSAKK